MHILRLTESGALSKPSALGFNKPSTSLRRSVLEMCSHWLSKQSGEP